MDKYLHQLFADIAFSVEMSSQLPEMEWASEYEEGEFGLSISASKLMSLPDIYQIPAAAFPPEKLLSDQQVSQLVKDILKLWTNWRIWSSLPPQLTVRQQYSALVRAMQHEMVAWSMVKGGDVRVCQFESGSFCPFGADGGYCYCRELDETVRHDLAIWEEHVRSQGLDPYLELSEEEGAAFEASKKNRNLQNQAGDDWMLFDLNDGAQCFEKQLDDLETLNEEEEWARYFLWEDFGKKNGPSSNNSEDLQADELI